MGTGLTSELVTMVLSNLNSLQSSLRFFQWAKAQPGFKTNSVMYDELVNIAGWCKDFETVGMLLTERVTQKSIAYCLARMRDAIQKARDLSAQSEHNQKRMHWFFDKLSISGQITEAEQPSTRARTAQTPNPNQTNM
jgi:hypothetical protein